jgi:hypothetical protein
MQHGLYRASGRAGLLLLVVSAIIPQGKARRLQGGFFGGESRSRDGWMQPTAFGARDRAFFEAILCSAPSSAADGQAVSHHQTNTLPV